MLTRAEREALVDPRWQGRRVAVGMSGGVDSSVAAVLLAEAGCEVVGMTMKLWDYQAVGGDQRRDGACCTVESFSDCRNVAVRHGFPHYTIDLTERFEQTVIDYFVGEYRRGRTPNPCVVCNVDIKWSALWEKARAAGCEALATGHYARLDFMPEEGVRLKRGVDRSRDQSYFLWGIPGARLETTIFPLGNLTKATVRALAAELGLVNAERPESRDICFVADRDLRRFLAERAAVDGLSGQGGLVVDRAGRPVGRHDGFESLTIGQRKGLGLALGRPQYVTSIDASTGTVTMGDNDDLLHQRCRLEQVRWLIASPSAPLDTYTQVRYRHDAAAARVTPTGGNDAEVRFQSPQRAITPGQSAVFYDSGNERVLGGGVIASVGSD